MSGWKLKKSRGVFPFPVRRGQISSGIWEHFREKRGHLGSFRGGGRVEDNIEIIITNTLFCSGILLACMVEIRIQNLKAIDKKIKK